MNSSSSGTLVITTFNVRSLYNKIDSVLDALKESNSDICCLQETWLSKDAPFKERAVRNKAKQFEYGFISCPRKGKRGGGLGFLYKKSLIFGPAKTNKMKTFEVTEAVLKGSNSKYLRLCCVYRTGPRTKKFLVEFSSYLDTIDTKNGEPFICGDFNIHMHKPNLAYTKKFNAILTNKDYKQHVINPTHDHNELLDLVLSKTSYSPQIQSITNILRTEHCTGSDHDLIKIVTKFETVSNIGKDLVKYRNLNGINLNSFREDLRQSNICDPSKYTTVANACELYDSCLKELLDRHSPLLTKYVDKDKSPWWNYACTEARRRRRKAERNFHRNRTDENLRKYRDAKNNCTNIVNDTCTSYESINVKTSYKYINSLLSRNQEKGVFPSGATDMDLAEAMSKHFTDKTTTIHSELESNNQEYLPGNISALNTAIEEICPPTTAKFDKFVTLPDFEIIDIMKSMNQTNCDLDTVPTRLIFDCIDLLIPIISFIVNQSLQSGEMPTSLKRAVLNPMLKKHDLDSEDMNSYRPISNLSFLSKVIEKCVYVQFCKYLDDNALHALNQSGYRKHHSCETAIAKVHNDILTVMDKKSHVVLLILDLSSAFDVVSHSILLGKLEKRFGVTDVALTWFKSYLTDRSFCTKVRNDFSIVRWILSGVPQGSILGPILFTLYTKDIESIAAINNFCIHSYADDCQLYTEFEVMDTLSVVYSVNCCIKDIEMWMSINFLKLNSDKTDIIVIKPGNSESSFSVWLAENNECDLPDPTVFVKSLGVYFDESLAMSKQISEIVCTCYSHLNKLRSISNMLNTDLKIMLINSLVLSRLDYGNSVLFGCSESNLYKLQKVLNSSVRFIYNLRRRTSIMPYLKKAHFLPVRYRIRYKIALLTFKCINNLAPVYLKSCIESRQSNNIRTRSDHDHFLLKHPNFTNNTLSHYSKSFKYSAPCIWNPLPYDIRCLSSLNEFKTKLKTYYFNRAFTI